MLTNWWRSFLAKQQQSQTLEWRGESICDEWFGSHFNYAADVSAEWLGEMGRKGPLLDFGCGDGITALGLKLRHNYVNVEGVDISTTHKGLEKLAQVQLGLRKLPSGLSFKKIKAGKPIVRREPFAAIMSWSAFEHIATEYLRPVISNLYDLVAPGGIVFIQINPLYHSPQGAHLGRFNLPDWAHLQWSRERVEHWVIDFNGSIPSSETEENFHKRTFGEYKEWVLQEFNQLNRISAQELKSMFEQRGFEVVREVYGKVTKIPPNDLLQKYTEDILRTDELRLLLQRPRTHV